MRSFQLLMLALALTFGATAEAQVDLSNWAISAKCTGIKRTKQAVYRIVLNLKRSSIWDNSYELTGGLSKRTREEKLLVQFDLAGTWSPPEFMQGIGTASKVRNKKEYHGFLAMQGQLRGRDDDPDKSDRLNVAFFKADDTNASLTMFCKVIKVVQPKPTPTPTATPGLTTNNWAGAWYCPHPGAYGNMQISGSDGSSSVRIDFPTAGWGPAYDIFTFQSVTLYAASGTYVYHDHHDSGVWTGRFTMELTGETIKLERDDDATSWHGSYVCERDDGDD
jgi:hypothetical protein